MNKERKPETVKNAAIGAAGAAVVTFIPGLNSLSPVFGGVLSGYLQDDGTSGGAKVGILMALISGIPVLLVGIYAATVGTLPFLDPSLIDSVVSFMGLTGGLLILALTLLWVVYAVILGSISGIVGGAIAG